jgi:hypothetical protein
MLVSGALFVVLGFIAGATALGVLHPSGQANQNQASPPPDGIIAQVQPLVPTASSQPRLPAYAFSTPEAVIPIVTLPDYPIPTPEVTVTVSLDPGPDLSPVVTLPYRPFCWISS